MKDQEDQYDEDELGKTEPRYLPSTNPLFTMDTTIYQSPQ